MILSKSSVALKRADKVADETLKIEDDLSQMDSDRLPHGIKKAAIQTYVYVLQLKHVTESVLKAHCFKKLADISNNASPHYYKHQSRDIFSGRWQQVWWVWTGYSIIGSKYVTRWLPVNKLYCNYRSSWNRATHYITVY